MLTFVIFIGVVLFLNFRERNYIRNLIKENIVSIQNKRIYKRLFLMTSKGLKYCSIQLAMYSFLSEFSSVHGIHGLALVIAIMVCILAYTMIFCWFYAIFPKANPIIPYIIYAIGVYLEIVSSNNWNFQKVTIDDYMLLGWSMPLLGIFTLLLKKYIHYKSTTSPIIEKICHWNVYGMVAYGALLITLLFTMVIWNCLY